MFDIDEFQRLREECHKIIKEENESVIKEWLNKIGYPETIGYYRDIWNRVFEIYAQYPGRLIGKGGSNVTDLKYILSEKFGGKWEVKFIEVRDGFINGRG